eukprot:g7135.t1
MFDQDLPPACRGKLQSALAALPPPKPPPVATGAPPMVTSATAKGGPVNCAAITRIAKDEEGLNPQPEAPNFKGALVQVYVRSEPFGGFDKSSNGHRYDSVIIANGMIDAGMSCQLIHYTHEEHDIFVKLCGQFDFLVLRIHPGHIEADGGNQQTFDDAMIGLRQKGVQTDTLLLKETADGHEEEHTLAEFMEYWINGCTEKSGKWTSKGSGKYFAKAEQAGGICDARYEEKDGKGELEFHFVMDDLVEIIHTPKGSSSKFYPFDIARYDGEFCALAKKFLAELPSLSKTLENAFPFAMWQEAMKTHRRGMHKLEVHLSDLSNELMALKECLVEVGILQQEHFLARLHNKRFAAERQERNAAHPLGSVQGASQALGTSELALAVINAAGPSAGRHLVATSRGICECALPLLKHVDQLSPSRIYVCGGFNGVASTPRAEFLDLQVGEWQALPSLSTARSGVAAGVLFGRLYVAGGQDGAKVFKTVECFDPKSKTWERLPPLQEARACAMATSIHDRLLICGGYDDIQFLKSAECFDPIKKRWHALPSMQWPREGAACVQLRGRLYMCGGFSGTHYLNKVEYFDSTNGCWQKAPALEEGRHGAAAARLGPKVIVCGGHQGARVLRSVECLDTREGVWQRLAPMSVKRKNASITSVGGLLFVFGGCDKESSLKQAECFDPTSDSWRSLPDMSCKRAGGSLAVAAGQIFVIGGADGHTCHQSVECFNVVENMWQPVAPMAEGRKAAAAVTIMS